MKELKLYLSEITARAFQEILLPMSWSKIKEAEMVFSTNLIDDISKNGSYPCYKFAHNLERHEYWRIRMPNITLEYIVTSDASTNSHNAYVHQIFKEGQLVYRRVNKPKWTIYVQLITDLDET